MPNRPEQTDYDGDVQPATIELLCRCIDVVAAVETDPNLLRAFRLLHKSLTRARRIIMGSTMTTEECGTRLGKFCGKNRLRPRRPAGPENDVKRMNDRLRKLSPTQRAEREADFARDGTPAVAPKPPKEIVSEEDFMATVRKARADEQVGRIL